MNNNNIKELEKSLCKEVASKVGQLHYSNWLSLNITRCSIKMNWSKLDNKRLL